MPKLLLCATLTLLSSCSSGPRDTTIPKPTEACRIPRLTTPDLAWHKCAGEVCLGIEDSIELSRHFVKVRQTQAALDSCSLVVVE